MKSNETCNSSRENPLLNTYDEKSTATNLNLLTRTHIRKKPNKCDICDQAFARKYHLKMHKRTHTSEKPYKCDLCVKVFSQKSNLKKGEKLYICDICDQAFALKKNFKKAFNYTYP